MLRKGDTVTLIVSTGPVKIPVAVISFVTLGIEKAKEQAAAMGLLVVEQTVDSEEPAGTVVAQNLDEGSQVYQGDTIVLSVSRGPVQPLIPPEPVRRWISFDLPQDGRDIVHMVVTVSGVKNFEQDVECAQGTISAQLTGSGVETVQVYYDQQLYDQYQVDFNE
jgi:serine/threonine-protein kinase